jgi:small GTP-binding protein
MSQNIFRSEVIKEKDDERFSEIERFLFKEMIPQIDRMNLFENEYEIFEEIKAEFEKYKILHIKPWQQKYTNFAFVGKFSTGKSSLINSLLEEKVLPVDLSPSTAVPTFIMYGIEKDIFFEDFKDSIRKLDASYFSKITEERLKHVPLSDLIKYFIVYTEKEFLKDCIIMDTPGIFSDDGNSEKTRKKLHTWISEVENIFWVIDITEGCIDRNSLSILSELSNKKIFLIINKADAVSPSNRKKVVAGIKDSCNKEKINISDIILYSSKEDVLHPICQDIFYALKL